MPSMSRKNSDHSVTEALDVSHVGAGCDQALPGLLERDQGIDGEREVIDGATVALPPLLADDLTFRHLEHVRAWRRPRGRG